jgi:hypothetical protein
MADLTVEAFSGETVHIRRDPDPGEGGLPYICCCTAQEWARFLERVKAGEFDATTVR